MFKAKMTALPAIIDEKTKGKTAIGSFTVGRKYRIYAVYDNGQFTDFLVADDAKEFHWINMRQFRGD
jgi:hypothetical protein